MDGTEPLPDARRAERKNCKVAGHLSFGDPRDRLPVVMINLSSTGACVVSYTPEDTGARWLQRWSERPLALVFEKEACAIDCDLVWHRDGTAGLMFKSGFRAF